MTRYHGNARSLVGDCFKSNSPQYLVDYMNSVYSLGYTQDPPYGKLIKLFTRSGADPIKTMEWVQPVSRKVSRL